MYAHYYKTDRCPGCDADLTILGAVRARFLAGDPRGSMRAEEFLVTSQLDAMTGKLLDVTGDIARGNFNKALCRACGEDLYDHERSYDDDPFIRWKVDQQLSEVQERPEFGVLAADRLVLLAYDVFHGQPTSTVYTVDGKTYEARDLAVVFENYLSGQYGSFYRDAVAPKAKE